MKSIEEKLWDLKEDYKKLEEENHELKKEVETLNSILSITKYEIEKRDQIIKILDKGYTHYHMTGKWALSYSKEAETMTYRDMEILQITLENIIKGVTGYED